MELKKLAKKYSEMKKMKMNEGDSLNHIIFIKYKEENIKKAVIGIKEEEKIIKNHNRGEENRYGIESRENHIYESIKKK